MTGLLARSAEPDLAAWTDSCRLNPAQAATGLRADRDVVAAYASMAENIGPALDNLARLLADAPLPAS